MISSGAVTPNYTNIELIEAAQRPLVPNVLHAASVHNEPTGIRFGRHQPSRVGDAAR
jgi:hypothetical protein